ncbi:G2/mitotic-specific cyclin-B [Culicoides brevitarsis]|uniref:G2/mitotic-specific cyclin-B n=1 Tax=Culicoides brevitarsis TaxID=469753 RepID=UPI00307B4CAB
MSKVVRAVRNDENNTLRINLKKTQQAPVLLKDTKRAALGEVGNRIIKNENVQKENILRDAKQPGGVYKNIKARVDSGLTKITTRSDTRKALTSVTNVNSQAGFAKALATQRSAIAKSGSVTTTTSVRVKAAELPKPQTAVTTFKREESHLTRRSLSKIRSALQSRKSSSTEKIDALTPSCVTIDTHSAKLLSQIENIDINDGNNPQLVSQYAQDIYNYLFDVERAFPIHPNHLAQQTEVTPKMRQILIDWISEVHLQFKLEIETFHMAVSIIDRYLQVTSKVKRRELQLVGVTALFIASKYEELYPPEINDFVYITDETYNKRQILDMEMVMFRALEFQLSKPLPIHFLRRFSKACKGEDSHHIMAKYLMELASVEYHMCQFHPSEIAAASLYLSLKLFPKSRKTAGSCWTETLRYYTRYTSAQLRPIVIELLKILKGAPSAKLKAVFNKYSSTKFDKIAVNPALNQVTLEALLNTTN